MQNVIRMARSEDVPQIVKYVEMASGGISDFFFEELAGEISTADLIEMILKDETTPLYYENFLVAEDNGKLIAASNFYPAKDHRLPEIMRTLIDEEKLKIMEPYLTSSVPGSLYIHTLSVDPGYRHITIRFNFFKTL